MSTLKTYRRAIAALAVALALALGCAGAATSHAWASVSTGALGLHVEVPSTIEQRPSDGSDPVKGGSGSLLGVNVQVPDRPADAGGTTGNKTSGASSLLGVNLEVPITIEQRPGAGDDLIKGGTSSLLGVNLQVPDPTVPDDPSDPGTSTTGKVSGAASLLGVNVEVPSTIEQRPGEAGGGSESVLGVAVKVPEGLFVSFVANGGQGSQMVQLAGTKAISADLSRFSWPGREIVGWYASPACLDDEWVMAADGVLPEEYAKAGARFYAKWSVTDPRAVGAVELHVVESEETGGNKAYISDAELAACGIQPAGYAEDVALTAQDEAPVYVGGYYPGGDGTVWPLPEDASEADREREGATLRLPVPVMEERVDESGTRNGIFEGWYKKRTAVTAPDGSVIRYDYAEPVEHADGAWSIGKFDAGTGEAAEPPYQQVLWAKWRTGTIHTFTFDADGGAFADGAPVKSIQVADGDAASQSSVGQPTREGYKFTGWWTAPDGEPRQKYAFSTPVRHAMTVYAGWEKVRYVVRFDSAGGSNVSSKSVEHGDALERPADPTRYGHRFIGWYLDANGDGVLDESELYDFAAPVTSSFTLVAKWAELSPDTYTVTLDAAGGVWENGPGPDDDETTRTAIVNGGDLLDEPEAPKQAGWQIGGWARDDGSAWDFDADVVTSDITLHALWNLRLDVTVPVSVSFAVNAETHEVTAPEASAYALKSRTVRPVEVEALALRSEQAEIEGFFTLAEGAGGSWREPLAATLLSLKSEHAADAIGLAFAGASGPVGTAWLNEHELDSTERGAWRLEAFDYDASGATFEGDAWQGADPSERLALELGLSMPDALKVKTGLTDAVPITHLKLTVSARA